MYRLGIDVGGTNTDAVIMNGRTVLAGVKASTTEDVTSGVLEALEAAIARAGVERARIGHVMIGTTHFTNAVIERKHINQVAAIRLGLPATACLPPMVDWPDDLRDATGGHGYLVRGGYEFDGREIAELDVDEIDRIADDIIAKKITVASVSSVFSPINGKMEAEARDRLMRKCPDIQVVMSCDIGRIGLLERESAAIMNASLLALSGRTVDAFARALSSAGLDCPFFITQNDGTLMAAETVKKFPVLTFASGPTNSMRGAAFLTGVRDGIVVDIGGTTTDIGALQHGFPRQAATVVDIGGVRTNFRMPDVFSIGLGGGSLVREKRDGAVTVGPQSVGYRITGEAMVFGGETLTATDMAVALGEAAFGTHQDRVASLDRGLLEKARAEITAMLERGVERSRISPDPIPVIAVGGGSILMPDRLGELEVIRPENFAVANAVGAAIAQISGEVDRIFSLENGLTREICLKQAEDEARARAIGAGADEATIETIEREDVPLAYLPGNATRIHVKVVGEMEASMLDRAAKTWSLDEPMIEALEIGSGILGTGGGGNPYIGKLRARQALREGYDLKVLPLAGLPDDAKVVAVGGIGAPLVSFERIKEGREGLRCVRALEERLGIRVDAIACEEIGGQNSMEPLIVAAMAGLPVVDCDGMGRAFPEMQMTTYAIYGHRSTPSVMCDLHGNVVIFDHAVSEKWHERMARACVVAQGGSSVLAAAPMSGAFVKQYAIPDSYTKAISLGNAVIGARRTHADPIEAVCRSEDGVVVFRGKINDLKRHLRGGFVTGEALLAGFDAFEGDTASIQIQNENLVFARNGEVEIIVPDLIVILDVDTGEAITTEMLRYGQRVAVLALPCHPLLRSQEALAVVGPAGFGFAGLTYKPMRPAAERKAS